MPTITPQLLDLMYKVAAAVIPGAPAALDAAKALVEFVKTVAPTLSETDQRQLQQALPDILSAMNAAVDQAIDDLGRGAS